MVRVPETENEAAPTARVDPRLIVDGPPSVRAEPPESDWTPLPLNTTGCPAGSESAAPLLTRSPARFIAPVMVLEYVTPLFRRKLPRRVSGLEPLAA